MFILNVAIVSMLVFNNINDYLEYRYKLWANLFYIGTRQPMGCILLSI